MSELAATIRAARLALPMSQEQLAGAAGLSRKTVCRIEGGEPPSAETLLALCSVLGLNASALTPSIAFVAKPGLPDADGLAAMATWAHDTPERKSLIADLARAAVMKVPGACAMVASDVSVYRKQFEWLLASGYSATNPADRSVEALRRRSAMFRSVQVAGYAVPLMAAVLAASAVVSGLVSLPETSATPPTTAWSVVLGILGMFAVITAIALYIVGLIHLGCIAERPILEIRDREVAESAARLLETRVYVMGRDGLHVVTRSGDTVEIVHVAPSRVDSFVRGVEDGRVTYVLDMAGRNLPVEPSPVEFLANRVQVWNDTFVLPFVQHCGPFEAGMEAYRNRTWSPTARFRLDEILAMPAAA